VAGEAPSLVAVGRATEQAGVPDAATPGPAATIHRLRDLDARGRRWAIALGLAVLLAPIAALIHFVPDWTPTGDPALMGLRSLDVGTGRTPLLGQPSTADVYSGGLVYHPGPLHFYLMAVPIRVLGGSVGMPLVSVVITGSCLLVALWGVFRQLGRTAGVVAAAVLVLTAFTTGASSLLNPVSSSIAGYPLLATAVLLWCLLCGDIRLLPLATGAASFTAQQHLSVDPAVAILTAGTVVIAALAFWRSGGWRRRSDRRELRRWTLWSAVVALVLWAPVLAQQVFGNEGNLGRMIWFARHGNGDSLGYSRATWQVAHALSLPPLLGRTQLTGIWLTSRPTMTTWASAAAVLGLVGVITWRSRLRDRSLAALGVMVALVCVAGLISGASVPSGLEQARLSFYHWAFVLAFLVAVTVGVALTRTIAAVLARRETNARRIPSPVALAVVAVAAVPAVVGVNLDRHTNTLFTASAYLDRAEVTAAADGVAAHRDELGEDVVVLSRGEPLFAGIREGVAYELVERGIDVVFPFTLRFFVHHQRLADRAEVDGAIVVVVDRALPTTPPEGGELVADLDLDPDHEIDLDAMDRLIGQAQSTSEVRLGPDLTVALANMSPERAELLRRSILEIPRQPGAMLVVPEILELLRDHPIESPAIDPELAGRVLESLPAEGATPRPGNATRVRVYLLDREETLRTAYTAELGPG
jgi:hypothetical protein